MSHKSRRFKFQIEPGVFNDKLSLVDPVLIQPRAGRLVFCNIV